ncbi:MAG: FdhF/YdeP family oxidoreductase [Bacteroidota bacterium]
MKRDVKIVPPEDFAGLRVTAPKEKAAGLPAVAASLKHISKEVGVFQGLKVLNQMNQKGGFDCPGCAWPDPDDKRSVLGEYCENGVKAIAEEATKKRVTPEFFAKYTVEELSKQSDYWLGKRGRITHPMYLAKDSSRYVPISWEEAFGKIAEQIRDLSAPDEACYYTSGRTSNEAAFLYQLFARQAGTNNLPDCSNMCHESSGKGLSETLGIGKGSVTLEDLHESELIVVMGQNPGTNHPRMLSALEKCKKNGGKIVSINPVSEAGNNNFINPQSPIAILRGGEKLSDLYLQVKINGDVALLKAAMYLLLEEENKNPGSVFDHAFINEKTQGFEAFLEDLKNTNFDQAVAASGIPESQIRAFARLLIEKKKIIICWAMGLTQHKNGVYNIREVVNLLLLRGSIGKPGAGTCPVRGHSNVQGDRTMGIWEAPPEVFLKRLDDRFSIAAPRKHGYDVVNAIKAMDDGKVKVFVAMGGNFISATPDSEFTGKALQNCDLTVQVSTKLNRSHLVTGKEALILPCISRSELDQQESGVQFVSVENSMGVVHSSTGTLTPASKHLLSEPAIVARLGEALFGNSPIQWGEMIKDYDVIRNHIEATIPGFEDYNKRVREPAGFYLPNGARKGEFNTASRKAVFTINAIPDHRIDKNHLVLMTIRSHDQYNTTIYGMNDRYRGIFNERRVLLMNKNDMQKHGFNHLDIVNLTSFYEGKERYANNFKVIEYDIALGCVATYFPEANVLVPIESVAEKSNTPVSKYIEVRVTKA